MYHQHQTFIHTFFKLIIKIIINLKLLFSYTFSQNIFYICQLELFISLSKRQVYVTINVTFSLFSIQYHLLLKGDINVVFCKRKEGNKRS